MSAEAHTLIYREQALRALAMPLGGLGCGSVAICGDGGLRQWQIFNNIYHKAHLPHSFFAIRAGNESQAGISRVLMSDAMYDDAEFAPPATANDHFVPVSSRELLNRFPGVNRIIFTGEYPIAKLDYQDDALALQVSLECFSPFIPLNAPDSGLPLVFFNFRVHNPSQESLQVALMASQQNPVGWDGVSPINNFRNKGYGGNINNFQKWRGTTGIHMSNSSLDKNSQYYGELGLWALESTTECISWQDPDQIWKVFEQNTDFPLDIQEEPSAIGETWNAALITEQELEPDQTWETTFLLGWYFPNREVDWEQWWGGKQGLSEEQMRGRIGNQYAQRFAGVDEVIYYAIENTDRLAGATRDFQRAFFSSTLPSPLLDAVSANISVLRSPTCLWTADGRFYGFEGSHGVSTIGGDGSGGACPLNCTHVWNYEMTLAHLFPDLERTMRETELDIQLAPDGSLPHRVTMPLDAPRPWGVIVGGPDTPALDGELGAILKVYRELQLGASREWFDHHWPSVKRIFQHIEEQHDPEKDGVITGDQPNTYDISIFGANSFIGSLYLATLRAVEEMARIRGELSLAESCRMRFEEGRVLLRAATWNDEYFEQAVNIDEHPEQQWGKGCHSDQLLGQWWAHILGLGHLFDVKEIVKTLESIYTYNRRQGFEEIPPNTRIFAEANEAGLLNCSWPRGGKPAVPTNYSHEVWTGIEYEVAGLMLYEGLLEQGLRIVEDVRARYDGRRRSPWNEIEYGDHYVRGMSSWPLLNAACGYRYNALRASLQLTPKFTPEKFSSFFITPTSWGRVSQKDDANHRMVLFEVAWGQLTLQELICGWERHAAPSHVSTRSEERMWEVKKLETEEQKVIIQFAEEIAVSKGGSLTVSLQRPAE